jgi:hypothetical protein
VERISIEHDIGDGPLSMELGLLVLERLICLNYV